GKAIGDLPDWGGGLSPTGDRCLLVTSASSSRWLPWPSRSKNVSVAARAIGCLPSKPTKLAQAAGPPACGIGRTGNLHDHRLRPTASPGEINGHAQFGHTNPRRERNPCKCFGLVQPNSVR